MKLWAAAWGACDATIQLAGILVITNAVCRVFDLRGGWALIVLFVTAFVVTWAHAALVLWAMNQEYELRRAAEGRD